MDGSQIAVVVAIIVVVIIAAGAAVRRSKPDGPSDRGPYSSSMEATGSFALFGTTPDRHHGESGGDAGGGDAGGGDAGGGDGGGD